jgi:hypothetical protein
MNRSAWVLVGAVGVFSGCVSILGDIEVGGTSTSSSTSTSGASSSTSGTSSSSSTSGTSSSSSGETCAMKGQTVACYDGPAATEGAGLCKAGTAACSAAGTLGMCMGEVLPVAETCANTADEDCNGLDCAQWVDVWGDSAIQEALAVAIDPFGNAIVVGQFSGAMKLDASHTLTGDAAGDGFVVALKPDGTVLWTQVISGAQTQTVSAVAADSTGNIYIGGYTQSAAPLGSTTIPQGLFVGELTHEGAVMTITPIGGSDGSVLADITTGHGGLDLAYGGAFLGTINLGQGPVTANAGTSGTGTDAFVYTSGCGGQVWGDGQAQSVRSVRFDSMENLLVAGTFQGTMCVGAEGCHSFTAQGISDAYLLAIGTGSGCGVNWGESYGVSGSTQVCTTLDVDTADNALVGGQYTGSIAFDGTPYTAPSSGSALFAFYVIGNGGAGWSKSFANGAGEVHAAFDASGNLVLAGGFFGDLDLGGSAVSNSGTDHAIFIGKLHADGTQIWLRAYGDAGEKDARAVAATGPGESLAVGIADGALSIGGGTPIQTAGGWDAFVARFAQ